MGQLKVGPPFPLPQAHLRLWKGSPGRANGAGEVFCSKCPVLVETWGWACEGCHPRELTYLVSASQALSRVFFRGRCSLCPILGGPFLAGSPLLPPSQASTSSPVHFCWAPGSSQSCVKCMRFRTPVRCCWKSMSHCLWRPESHESWCLQSPFSPGLSPRSFGHCSLYDSPPPGILLGPGPYRHQQQ